MKKLLLLALAISLGSIAFAGTWDPEELPSETCNYFAYGSWQDGSLKGCLTCPVRDGQGHLVKCETNPNRDCCWLNTPTHTDPVLGNCYTNACVLGPNPWSVKCICKLNCAMNNPTQNCYAECNTIQHPNQVPSGYSCNVPNGNGGNGGTNGGTSGGTNLNTSKRPKLGTSGGTGGTNGGGIGHKNSAKTNQVKKPSRPVVSGKAVTLEKQTPVQSSSKKTAK